MVSCSNDSEVYAFGKGLLDSMPPHSLLTTLGDLQHNSVKYSSRSNWVCYGMVLLNAF